jgi:hypothetical protein
MPTLMEQLLAPHEMPWRDPRYNDGSIARQKLEQMVAKKKLTTKAKDNHGYEYDVYLYMNNLPTGWVNPSLINDEEFHNEMCFKWVLRITGTPGGWYMSTLLGGDKYATAHVGSTISIDFGQDWNCINFDEVLAEAKQLI